MRGTWLVMIVSFIVAIKTAGYGIYTMHEKNISGAVCLYVITLICAAVAVMSIISLITGS